MDSHSLTTLSDVDLIGRLIGLAHLFGDVIQETDDAATELRTRLSDLRARLAAAEAQAVQWRFAEADIANAKDDGNYLIAWKSLAESPGLYVDVATNNGMSGQWAILDSGECVNDEQVYAVAPLPPAPPLEGQ